MTTPNTAANGGKILTDERIAEIADATGMMAKNDVLSRLDGGLFCIDFARAIEADLRAAPAAVPASEPVALTEHDLGIIRDIDAMASAPNDNWWSKALALGASRIIKNLRAAAPAPVSGMPDLAGLPRWFNSEFGIAKFSAVQHKNMPDVPTYFLASDVERLLNPTKETK